MIACLNKTRQTNSSTDYVSAEASQLFGGKISTSLLPQIVLIFTREFGLPFVSDSCVYMSLPQTSSRSFQPFLHSAVCVPSTHDTQTALCVCVCVWHAPQLCTAYGNVAQKYMMVPKTRLSWFSWLAGYMLKWYTGPEMVTDPRTNRAGRRVTLLMRWTTTATTPRCVYVCVYVCVCVCWCVKVRKMKAIFYTLNQFGSSGSASLAGLSSASPSSSSQKSLIGECWCPVKHLDVIHRALRRGTVRTTVQPITTLVCPLTGFPRVLKCPDFWWLKNQVLKSPEIRHWSWN